MKRILLSLTILCIGAVLFAQAPQSFKYQTVVRDNANEILDNENVYFRISILQYSDVGTAVYEETFDRTTNDFGLVTFNIGEGDVVETGVFEDIDWGNGPYYVKVEVDIDGSGTTYGYEVTGTSELLSVPYALYAKNSGNSFSGDYSDLENSPALVQSDTTYYVKLISADEDYIDFGTFEGFTNSSDWSVIERVMMPIGTGSDGGWHFFRGKAWADKEGDIAISISSTQIHAWCQQSGWKSVIYSTTLNEETWYDLCLQYDATANTLNLYLNGTLVGQTTGVSPQNDAANTNKLFWGGQDVAPGAHGDLYSEASIVISSQHWLQRKLTEDEIINYDGYMEPEADLFFSAKINRDNVTDDSGNGHNGTNGNSPEYIYDVYKHTDFSDDLYINGDLTVSGNLKVLGNLEVGGTITGSVEIDTIHFSQISGLLGQGYSMIFPQVLDNKCTLELEGISTTDDVIIVSTIGTETERISEYIGIHGTTGDTIFKEHPGLTAEYPLVFETTNETDMLAVKAWFDESSPVDKSAGVVIKNAAGTETGRWTLNNYVPDHYEEGTDGRTRFTMILNELPDNVNKCQYSTDFGSSHSYNPETDKLVEIQDITHPEFTPAIEIDFDKRTITLTMDYSEGAGIYPWVKDIISGIPDDRCMCVIETTDGTSSTEYQRFNYYNCIPIRYEHIYGFGLNTKLKARVVIAYGFREEG